MFIWFASIAIGSSVEEIEIVGEARPADGPSVTVVEVDDRLPASAELADAVQLAPGAVVRRLGGLGALSTVSIRGSSARQVEVLLDGVPLNPDGGAALDLSELPLRAFSRIEIYRGNPPPSLPVAPVGGVVQLITGEERRSEATFSAGSLGSVRATGAWAGPAPGGDALVVVDAFTAQNTFRYLDDNGTVYVPEDDTFRIRSNAQSAQGSAHLRYRWGDERLQFTALQAFVTRDQGVPGFTFAPTHRIRHQMLRDLQAFQLTGQHGALRWTGLGWLIFRQERLDDPEGEVGMVPREVVDRALAPGGRASLHWAPDSRVALLGALEIRGDQTHSQELREGIERRAGRVVGRAHLGASVHLFAQRLALSPGVVASVLDAGEATTRSIDPRLGLRLDLGAGFALTGNAGRYLRPPDLVELFGDRGSLVGNPALRPERGTRVDLGLQLQREGGRVELVAFDSVATDRITLVHNAQRVAMPVNLDGSRVRGLEAAGAVVLGPLELNTSLSRTWSRQRSDRAAYDGKQLPRVPAWELNHRTAVELGAFRLGHTLSHASPTWFDATNWYRSAPRTLHGAFLRATDGSVSVELGVFNLLDRIVERVPRNPLVDDGETTLQGVTDFLGQPLPGRTLFLTLRWSPEPVR